LPAAFSENASLQALYLLVLRPVRQGLPLNKHWHRPNPDIIGVQKILANPYFWSTIISMETQEQKRKGRPPKPADERRTARLQMRTFPDIAEKAARVGTEAVEAAIRKIKEPK
jgi:hypothetical protein